MDDFLVRTNRTWVDSDGYTLDIFFDGEAVKMRLSSPKSPTNEAVIGNMGEHGYVSCIDAQLPPAYIQAIKKVGKNPRDYRMVSGTMFRASAEPFVVGVLNELRAEVDRNRAAAKAALLANVPGLEQLRAAYDDVERYRGQFNAMMVDESNDGVRPPTPVRVNPDDLAKQYPIAAAYLKAEAWENAAHYAKSTAGRKAKARIGAGEDWEPAIAEMETEWSAHCNAHVWD